MKLNISPCIEGPHTFLKVVPSYIFAHFPIGFLSFFLSIFEGSLCFRDFRLLTLLTVLFLTQKINFYIVKFIKFFSLVHLDLKSYLGNLSLNPDFSSIHLFSSRAYMDSLFFF